MGGNICLDTVDSDAAEEYYQALLQTLAAAQPGSLEVRLDAGGNRGKGLFASHAFKEGDIIFQERPLVGIQELHSKMDTSTCAKCFTAVGTVEQAFGGKICCLINELSDATEADDLREIQDKVDKIQAAVDSKRLEGLLSGKVQLPLTDRVDLSTTPVRCRGGCEDEYCCQECEQSAWERHHCLLCPGPAQQQAAGSSSKGKHSCAGSSSSSSRRKAAAQTEVIHGARVNRTKLAKFLEHADDTNDIFRVAAQVIASTIITADKILQQAAADAAEGSEAAAAYSRALSAAAAGQRAAAQQVLAAPGPAAATASSAQLAAAVPDAAFEQEVAAAAYQAAASSAAAGAGSSSRQVLAAASAEGAASKLTPDSQQQQPQPSDEQCLAALKAAFLPYQLGHKAPWWQVAQAAEEAAAADGSSSDGEDEGSSSSEDVDPAEVAAQLRELAAESLALLRAGLQDDRFPQLFDLQLYGSLVGMFELNNLALTVPAPVARYKALLSDPAAHGVSPAEAAAALDEVMPLLDALGEDADGPAEGTGFFALQSTINHSCAPNAAADCLPSGQAVITALSDITAGSEVLLSYIEEEGAGLRERRRMLRDYGFTCACQRCEAEQLADSLQQQQL